MKTIKKITTKTIVLVMAFAGIGFVSSFFTKLFFEGAEINLSKLESVVKKDVLVAGSIISIAQADVPPSTGGDGAGSCSDGSGDGCGSGCY